jgi:hypothetical protein
MTGFASRAAVGGYNSGEFQGLGIRAVGEGQGSGGLVRRMLLLAAVAALVFTSAAGAQAPPKSAEAGKTTWFFYTVKWGHQDEFLDLFQKNHYPVLKALRDAGVYRSVRTYVPTNHGDGRADWTFAVELTQPPNPSEVDEPALVRKLFPDQATFQKEEQRRFEILAAHWDVPLNVIDFDARKPQ